jgi:hypothetical protein
MGASNRVSSAPYPSSCMPGASEAKPRAGVRRRSDAAVVATRRLPCGARARGPSRNSLRSLAFAALEQSRRARQRSALRARPRALRSSAPHMSLPTHTHPRLCRCHRATHHQTPRASMRGGRYPVGAICGAARSAALRSARAQRALQLLTRRDCSSTTNAVSGASFAARPQCEHHSGVGAKRRPTQYEPPLGIAHRAALNPCMVNGS